jgi:hypothetical protein
MKRRHFILASSASIALPGLAQAQVIDINDAINKAGRQRMLSQRMAKAWMALAHQSESPTAAQVMDKSISLFDRQLVELKAFAPTAEIKDTYIKLEYVFSEYKGLLVGALPAKTRAQGILATDAKVLALAHQGTVQYEAVSGKPLGKLVNMAGRQRMLSQRMAKFYLASRLPVEPATASSEITKARTEFLVALEALRNAPEATDRIKQELTLADGQWVFFDAALKNEKSGPRQLADVFDSSENLLSVMDRVTGLYSSMKA